MGKAKPVHEMEIRDFSLWVSLGCEASERAQKQEVTVSVRIKFAEEPSAIFSDAIDETHCYAILCGRIAERVENREFKLIERPAHEVYTCLRDSVGSADRLELSVCKVRPPVANLRGGVVYKIHDVEN